MQKSSTKQVAIWRLTKQEEENMQLESSAFEQYFRDVTWNMTTFRKLRNLGTAKYVASKRRMEVSARDVENRQNSKYDVLEGKLEMSSKEWDKYHIKALRQNCRCSQISH